MERDSKPKAPGQEPATEESAHDTYWLKRADLIELVRLGPLISIDLIPRGPDGKILTGLRNNEPARGSWFVPGGRINKGESLDRAFRRIARGELGLSLERSDATALGVFEHFYTRNFAGTPNVGTHYVVLAYLVELSEEHRVRRDSQHQELRWFTPEELTTEPAVHRNTKVYGALDLPQRPQTAP